MPGGDKAAHVGTGFRQDAGGRQGADARNRVEKMDQGAKGGLPGRHLLVHGGDRGINRPVDLDDRLVQRVILLEVEPEQETVMIGQPPMQRIVKLFGCGLDASIGQGRQPGRIADPGDSTTQRRGSTLKPFC